MLPWGAQAVAESSAAESPNPEDSASGLESGKVDQIVIGSGLKLGSHLKRGGHVNRV